MNSAFLEGNGASSSSSSLAALSDEGGFGGRSGRAAYALGLLQCLRSSQGLRVVDRDFGSVGAGSLEGGGWDGAVDFVVGEGSGVYVLDASAVSGLSKVKAFSKSIVSASVRFDELWVVIDLGERPGAGAPSAANSRPPPVCRGEARVQGPKIVVRAPRSVVSPASGLPDPVLSKCLSQLSRSVWHFPCPVHVRYAWGQAEAAALVRDAADAAASAAAQRDPDGDPVARCAAVDATFAAGDEEGGDGGHDDDAGDSELAFLEALPPLNVFSASAVLSACRGGSGGGAVSGLETLLAVPTKEALQALVPRAVPRQRLDDLFGLLHLEPPRTERYFDPDLGAVSDGREGAEGASHGAHHLSSYGEGSGGGEDGGLRPQGYPGEHSVEEDGRRNDYHQPEESYSGNEYGHHRHPPPPPYQEDQRRSTYLSPPHDQEQAYYHHQEPHQPDGGGYEQEQEQPYFDPHYHYQHNQYHRPFQQHEDQTTYDQHFQLQHYKTDGTQPSAFQEPGYHHASSPFRQDSEMPNPAAHWPQDIPYNQPVSRSVQKGKSDKLAFRFDPSKRGGQTVLHWEPRRSG